MTVAEGLPCIDLYARPRRERQKYERVNRIESAWIGGVLALILAFEGIVMREQLELGARVRTRAGDISRLEIQKTAFERSRSAFALQVEKMRGLESSLSARIGWLRLLQAISAVTTDREALEQCAIEGPQSQRAITITGAASNLVELQSMLQRLKALRCLQSVRLMETAADQTLGESSVHFRIVARCDAADLRQEAPAK